jgi:hypothetical protein
MVPAFVNGLGILLLAFMEFAVSKGWVVLPGGCKWKARWQRIFRLSIYVWAVALWGWHYYWVMHYEVVSD